MLYDELIFPVQSVLGPFAETSSWCQLVLDPLHWKFPLYGLPVLQIHLAHSLVPQRSRNIIPEESVSNDRFDHTQICHTTFESMT